MTTITVCFASRTLEMTKTFATAASKFGSAEYQELMQARRDFPGFEVVIVTRKASKSKKPSYKGLTYSYMEKYIKAHDDAEKSIMAEYEMLRGISEAAQEALAEPCNYNEMKTWFLKTFPEIANFHKMREELVSAA